MAVQTLTTTSFDFLHNTQHLDYIINATDYWPFVGECSIWNAAVARLQLSVDFSYCWINLVEAWYSLEQYIRL